MASINTIVKRKQYLWLGIVVVGAASAIGGALYLSDVDMSGNGETVAEQEPVPDMTGVVDTTFDDKVRQHATTEMQVTAAQMAGLVMTVLTVGLVSCAGKSLPRFWPGDFFPTFYACHLAVLGVLVL